MKDISLCMPPVFDSWQANDSATWEKWEKLYSAANREFNLQELTGSLETFN